MWRRLFQLALVALLVAAASGCATTYEYYGDERYHEPVGGVVYDSDPEAEFQETVNKSRAIARAAETAGAFARIGGN